jgi:hypothetical protein
MRKEASKKLSFVINIQKTTSDVFNPAREVVNICFHGKAMHAGKPTVCAYNGCCFKS